MVFDVKVTQWPLLFMASVFLLLLLHLDLWLCYLDLNPACTDQVLAAVPQLLPRPQPHPYNCTVSGTGEPCGLGSVEEVQLNKIYFRKLD